MLILPLVHQLPLKSIATITCQPMTDNLARYKAQAIINSSTVSRKNHPSKMNPEES